MALSIVGRVAGLIGPGYSISMQSSLVGPIPVPAWWGVQVRPHGGGNFLCAGAHKQTNGAHSGSVVMGIVDAPFTLVGLLDIPLAQGGALDVDLYLTDAAFGNIDGPTTIAVGWTWDSVNGIYILASRAPNDTSAIRAAVVGTYHNS